MSKAWGMYCDSLNEGDEIAFVLGQTQAQFEDAEGVPPVCIGELLLFYQYKNTGSGSRGQLRHHWQQFRRHLGLAPPRTLAGGNSSSGMPGGAETHATPNNSTQCFLCVFLLYVDVTFPLWCDGVFS